MCLSNIAKYASGLTNQWLQWLRPPHGQRETYKLTRAAPTTVAHVLHRQFVWFLPSAGCRIRRAVTKGCGAPFSPNRETTACLFRTPGGCCRWRSTNLGFTSRCNRGRRFSLNDYDRRNTLSYFETCLLYTSPSPRDKRQSRMPSSA